MAEAHKQPTTLRCACGEHYVAAYLSGMGMVVALTRRGTPATDMLVTSESGGKAISLQIKTGGVHSRVQYKRTPDHDYWVWRVKREAAESSSPALWYAFVYAGDWPSGPEPELFFVPSKQVAKTLRENPRGQKEWFWMYKEDAAKNQGLKGAQLLRKAVGA